MGAYQLKIIIKGSKPPIWRRILVPQGIPFEELHKIIQTAYGWSGDGLYQFEFRSKKVRIISDEQMKSEKYQNQLGDEKLDDLITDITKFTYTYQNREIVIEIEDKTENYKDSYAKVIKFKGDAIPELCGEVTKFYELEKLEEYDVEAVNKQLAEGFADSADGAVHLNEIYSCYDKDSIIEIAKRHNLSENAELNEKKLIENTIYGILDKEAMRSYFLCVRDREIDLFEKIIDGSNVSFETCELDFLYAGGYVTANTNNGFMVSEEVKKVYKEFNTPEFQAEREQLSKIGDYLCAANSLYAITPLSVVLETYNKYEDEKITVDQLLQAYECLLPYRLMVCYIDGKFIDAALVEQKSYDNVYNMQKKVPYYIPTQDEVRYMADNRGFLMNSELSQLSEFLSKEMNVSDDRIPYLLDQIQAEISIGGQLQEVLASVEASGILLESEGQVEKFTSIITDVWNHTRMILNRGHKPYEMVMKGLEDTSAQRKNIKKVYPNELCPCGSGKKYKKCCGKRA